MAIGWRQLDGAWYYFNSDGRMATGMIEVGGLRYYMDPSDGRMVSGRAVEINGVTYQAAADGHLSQQGQETTGEFPIVKDTTPNITNSRLNNIP